MQLTLKQKAEIYCVKNDHASYITNCMGYKYCGRCGTQIGDTLAGVFDTSNMILVGHDCKTCDTLKEKLSPLDKEILLRLERDESLSPDLEQILKGLDLE